MPVRIQFRLGSIVPASEIVDVGQPIYNPETNALGMGAGSAQPLWYPGIDQVNQDLVLYGTSLIRGATAGARDRFGWDSADQFSMYTFSGLRLRVTDSATTIYNTFTASGGGSLSGNFNTAGGRFTSMSLQEIDISSVTNQIVIKDQNGNKLGQIDSYGISTLQQQDLYLTMAAQNESQAQLWRSMFSSGYIAARQYSTSRPFDKRYQSKMGGFSALNIHNHPDWQGICGISELSVLINGHFLQTRHADYRMAVAVYSPSGNPFGTRVLNSGPPVPTACSTLSLGYTGLVLNSNLSGTQVQFMQNIYNTPQYCVYELAYLEVWIQAWNGTIDDVASSLVELGLTDTFQTNFDIQRGYGLSGLHLPLENLPLLPGLILTKDASGHPVFGYLNWRISSIPVATPDVNTNTVTYGSITYNLRALPYNATKAAAGVVDSTNRFKVRRDDHLRWWTNTQSKRTTPWIDGAMPYEADSLSFAQRRSWLSIANDANAMFDCVDLEDLCAMCPGFDGIGAYFNQYIQEPDGIHPAGTPLATNYSTPNWRGMSYYSNWMNSSIVDASGFNNGARGFADTNLFVAECTTNTNILGGWTWMLPLELVLRTPRENWNPFNIAPVATPTGDGSYTNPYSGYNAYGQYFTLPADFIPSIGTFGAQPADTRTLAYMITPSGTKQFLASGINIFDYDAAAPIRRRFPLIPDANQFSSVGREVSFLKATLKGILKQVAAGTITGDQIDDAF